jgi:hypothetical protein
MSNSGSGAFMAADLRVHVPILWLLEAIGKLEDGDEEAQALAEGLSGCLPPVPAAAAAERMERNDDDGVADVQP